MTKLHRLFPRGLARRCTVVSSLLALALPPTASAACLTATVGGAWQGGGFTAQSGTFTVSFDATPSASPTNSVVGLSNGTQNAYSGYACLVRFNPSGAIDARNGGAYAAAQTIPYSANRTYHFRVVANVTAHTYSAFVTPPGGSELTIGSNYAFRTEQNTVASLNAWAVFVDAGSTGSDTVCNFALAATSVAAPTFAPGGGSYSSTQSVSIASTTSGASVRYTTDGSTPTSSTGTVYAGPVTIATTTTLKAIAYASGLSNSSVTSATYTINTSTGTTVSPSNGFYNVAFSAAQTGSFTATIDAVPSISPSNATIGLCHGAQSAYTGLACVARFNSSGNIDARNGGAYAAASTIPFAAGVSYHFRFVVDVPAHTYSIYVTPAGGSEVTVGTNYAFRTEQNTVTSLDTWNIDVAATPGGTVTIGNLNVTASSGGGTVAAPVFSPAPGSYSSAPSVTIASGTSGASIRYTLDGSTPTTTTGTVYSGPVTIGSTTTLKAVAYASGLTTSSVTSGTYTIGSTGGVTSTGTISFHLLLGVSSSQDSLSLAGDNYTDLIMSNTVAGVMYGHIVQQYFPGIQFNKDYLFGSIFGQLLQENLATQLYTSSSNLIDPSPDQQAVMGSGQGGPYQINNYAIDMVSGSYTPAGHSLINYIAIQKNIGFTMATASTQYSKPTPPSFNNKYYGPMLCAFFHYNDLVALNIIGKGPGGWTTPWQPAFDQAMANFVNLPNSFLDVILNVGYNQGFYGTLEPHYCQLGATATSSTVAAVNSYSSTWGSSDTYQQYPYQVHYYLDQIYDNPIPTTSPSNTTTPANHLAFAMAALGTVFSDIAQTLAYSNGTNAAQFFTAAQAQSAWNGALTQYGVSSAATFDFSRASDRATIYNVIDSAIGRLETTSGMKFNSTTNSQL
jgi:hypothetical protein